MKFIKSKLAVLVSSAIISSGIAAQGSTPYEVKINSKRFSGEEFLSKNSSHQRSNVLTKGLLDNRLGTKVFNWNNGDVKNISLDKNSSLKSQYRSSLDNYFKQVASSHGANKWSQLNLTLDKLHDTGRGGIIGQYNQKVNGVEVFGRFINILINRNNEFVASSGYFATANKFPSASYAISESEALAIAFNKNTGESLEANIVAQKQVGQPYSKLVQSQKNENFVLTKNSRVKKVYFPVENEKLIPAYYVEAETVASGSRNSKYFSYVVDGISGKVVFENNLTAHVTTTYKVFADATGDNIPFDGPHGNDFTPHPTGDIDDTPAIGETYTSPNTITLDHGPISTSDPWLSENDTTTSGNNVNAYADISGEDGFDAQDVQPEMTGANAFEYDFGQFIDGTLGDGQKHAVVNLFYVNNFLHNWFYDNGFDEASGNAQRSNYGRGGVEGDALNVEAQDASGTNNANMSTPSDGAKPRMQMYLFTFLSDSDLLISGVANTNPIAAGFGPADFDVTGVMEVVNDGTDPSGDACETILDDLTGKIAIIDRGACNFTQKVKNAQDLGAVGVIMVNNVEGDAITMGGDDDTITIPSMMVTLDKGQEIKNALAADDTLQAQLVNISKPLDGTLDHGIVAHEWGHYITNRLVGNANGLSNNQGRSMGEGWGDFISLLMIVREDDALMAGNDSFQGVYSSASFVENAYSGVRRVPYSTDMTKNALTFKHIEANVPLPDTHPVQFGQDGSFNAGVHSSGEIWASALWTAYVGLINKPGYSFEQAQEAMKDYLVAGLKMTPNAPTMLEARDAILASAFAANAEDFDIIKAAFAERGMGASAIAPPRNSEDHSGVVEDFSAGVAVQTDIQVDTASFDIGSCDQDGVLDAGESATFSVTYRNYTADTLPEFTVNLSSSDDVSFDNNTITVDSLAGFGSEHTSSFEVTLNSATFMQEISIQADVNQIGGNPDDYEEPTAISTSLTTNFDYVPTNASDDMSNSVASQNDWTVELEGEVDPFVIVNGEWYGADSGAPGASDLVTPVLKVAATGDFVVSFNHFFLFESSENEQGNMQHWDGGVVEVSVDGGDWVDVVDYGATLLQPYNGVIDTFNEVIGGRNAYTFISDDVNFDITPNSVTFPDGLVNGHNIQIRFRIGTDANTGAYGWAIDDVMVDNAIEPMFSDVAEENNSCIIGSAPIVSAGDDIVIVPTDSSDITVNLSGTASDIDDDNLTVEWTQRAGPEVTINNSNTLDANFTVAAPTSSVDMVFELTVTDGSYVVTDLVNVSLNLNQAPTVTASGSIVTEGQTANLTATGSDPDGDELSYQWTQTSGPTVTLNGDDSANASFLAPNVESDTTFTFEVVVSDGVETSAPATATVTVNNTVESSGGGGSIPVTMLAMLATLFGLRRRHK